MLDCILRDEENADMHHITAKEISTGQMLRLFTDQKPIMTTCVYGLGEKAEIEYDAISGEIIAVNVAN